MSRYKIALKNRETNPESWQEFYESEIVRLIRKRYSINQELAILRQRDDKPDEYAAYNQYVEECKAEVKSEIENTRIKMETR